MAIVNNIKKGQQTFATDEKIPHMKMSGTYKNPVAKLTFNNYLG